MNWTICPRCEGDGEEIGAPMDPHEFANCSLCNGRGEVPQKQAEKYLKEA